MWLLGTKPQSTGKVASTLSFWDIFELLYDPMSASTPVMQAESAYLRFLSVGLLSVPILVCHSWALSVCFYQCLITLTCDSQINWSKREGWCWHVGRFFGWGVLFNPLQKMLTGLLIFLVNKTISIYIYILVQVQEKLQTWATKISIFVGDTMLGEVQQCSHSGSSGLALTRWSLIRLIAQPGPHSKATQLWAAADWAVTWRRTLGGVTMRLSSPGVAQAEPLCSSNKLLSTKRWRSRRGGSVFSN